MVVLCLAKIIDQNGPSGHWIFIDIGQKVNIDAENLKEIPFERNHFLFNQRKYQFFFAQGKTEV